MKTSVGSYNEPWSAQFKFEVTTAMRQKFTLTQIAALHYPAKKDESRRRKLKQAGYNWAAQRKVAESQGRTTPKTIWPGCSCGRAPATLGAKDAAKLKRLFTVSA